MTVGQLLKFVDETKPNHYNLSTKMVWLAELEARVHGEVLRHPHPFPTMDEEDQERVLLAPEPHTAFYRWWLYAMIDMTAEGYEKYQNDMQLFNAAWEAYHGWYLRTHPVGGRCACPTVNTEWGDPLCQG